MQRFFGGESKRDASMLIRNAEVVPHFFLGKAWRQAEGGWELEIAPGQENDPV